MAEVISKACFVSALVLVLVPVRTCILKRSSASVRVQKIKYRVPPLYSIGGVDIHDPLTAWRRDIGVAVVSRARIGSGLRGHRGGAPPQGQGWRRVRARTLRLLLQSK